MIAIIFNLTFFSMFFGQVIAIFLMQVYGIVPREYFLTDITWIGFITYFISFLSYMLFFNIKAKGIKNIISSNVRGYNWIFILYLCLILFYWIPVFLLRGVSGDDRVAYWSLNSDIKLQSMLYTMYFVSLAVVLSRNGKSYNIFTFISMIVVTVLCGERVTGIVFTFPVLFFAFRDYIFRISALKFLTIAAFLFLLLFLFKVFTYYYDGSVNYENILLRLVSTGGLLSSVMQHDEYFNFFLNSSIIVPYQDWGLSDKSYLMTLFFKEEYLAIARSTQGLTGGSMVETLIFGLHWSVVPLVTALIGYIYGWFVYFGVKLLQSRIFLNSALGFVLILTYGKRLLGVVHSGYITDILRLESLFVILTAFVVYLHYSTHLKGGVRGTLS